MIMQGIDHRDGRRYTMVQDNLIDALCDAVDAMQTAGRFTAACAKYARSKHKTLLTSITYADSRKAAYDRARADRHLLRLYRVGRATT